MEIQQSSLYAKYISSLHWTVERVGGSYVYIKYFPLLGALAKIQRTKNLPNPKKLITILRKHRVTRISIEPDAMVSSKELQKWHATLSKNFVLLRSPYLPAKTIRIDLTPTQEVIFNKFSEAKRRAVRRALKNNLQIYRSSNINEFISLKNKSAGFLGFMTTYGATQLWQTFPNHQRAILLANNPPVAGTLLLMYDKIAYYWLAAATKEGKKLSAPTLLVWYALKLSKQRGCKEFDFVGVWDERTPQQNKNWKGFTKFKEGFGGDPLYYPIVR